MFSQPLRIVEAYCLLVGWSLYMKRHSFQELYERLRSIPTRTKRSGPISADRICDAVEIACALYPRQVLCLQRSCVLTLMLRKRGLPARLTIGSQRSPFRAHAWVTLDGRVLRDKLAQRESFLIMEVC